MTTLTQLTTFLIEELDRLKDIFYEEQTNLDKNTYFNYVQKDSKQIFESLSEWENAALEYVKLNKSKINFKQIIATKENIELNILHSYYRDIRKRRYMEYYSSTMLVLKLLSNEISGKK